MIMDVNNLIGRVLREAPKEIKDFSQQLLLRSGSFLMTGDRIIVYEGGRRIIERTILLFTIHSNATQGIQFGTAYREFLQSEFSTYRSVPKRFHSLITIEEEGYRPLGMLYPKIQPQLEIHFIHDTVPDIKGPFTKLGLNCIEMKGISGISYFVEMNIGKEIAFICSCGYASLSEAATFKKKETKEQERPLEEIETPNCKTIEEVADFIGVPKSKTAKAVFYYGRTKGKEKVIFAVIRGDLEINEKKLKKVLALESLRDASDNEIKEIGAQPGYASPIGIVSDKCIVIVDTSIEKSSNLVAGANKEGYHLLNSNFPRDYAAHYVADIAQTRKGDPCPNCQKGLIESRGVAVASIEKKETEVTFLDKKGKPEKLRINILTIPIFTLLATIVFESHDKYGVIFPRVISPWDLMIVQLSDQNTDQLLEMVENLGLSYLLDSRKLKNAQKFMEADLRGIPIEIVVSNRNNGKFEVKERDTRTLKILSMDELEVLLRQRKPF